MLQDKIMCIRWETKQYAELQSEFKVIQHLWKFAEMWRWYAKSGLVLLLNQTKQ